MAKYKYILCLFILSVSNGYTQNLILNGSFEDVDTTKIGFDKAINWQQSSNGSPDLFLPTGIPYYNSSDDTNGVGFQIPQHGFNYIGMENYWKNSSSNPNIREPIIGKTRVILSSGIQYCLSYYLSLADLFNCSVNRIDAYFSATPHDPTLATFPFLIYYPPHVSADTSIYYSNKLNWVRIEGYYTAVGGENYITFGNLHMDIDTDTLCNGVISGYPNAKGTYNYMDNFSLEEIKPVDAGNDIFINTGNSTIIGNNSDSASTYYWSPNYFIDDTNAVNPTVNPPVTTTYYVTKTQCSVTTTDSVTVFVAPLGLSEFSNEVKIYLYPNPTKGLVNILFKDEMFNQKISISVRDIMGKTVLESNELIPIEKSIPLHLNVQNGIYFVVIVNNRTKEQVIKKLVIQQ